MKSSFFKQAIFILLFITFSGQSLADGKITISEHLELNTDADTVWALVRDFGDLSWIFLNGEGTVEVPGSSFDIGAIRTVVEVAGGSAQEVLIAHDDVEKYYSFVLVNTEDSTIINYLATLRVFSHVGGKTKVEWSSSFDVIEGVNAAAVQENIIGRYRFAFNALRQTFD